MLRTFMQRERGQQKQQIKTLNATTNQLDGNSSQKILKGSKTTQKRTISHSPITNKDSTHTQQSKVSKYPVQKNVQTKQPNSTQNKSVSQTKKSVSQSRPQTQQSHIQSHITKQPISLHLTKNPQRLTPFHSKSKTPENIKTKTKVPFSKPSSKQINININQKISHPTYTPRTKMSKSPNSKSPLGVQNFSLSLLHQCKLAKSVEVLKLLNSHFKYLDLTVQDGQGWSCLHFACYNCQKDVVQKLLENGANVNATNSLLQTPLIIASQRGGIEISKLLLKFGAVVNQFDKYGNTCLHYAVLHNQVSMVDYLLKVQGINFCQTNCQNMTAYEVSTGQIKNQFMEHFQSNVVKHQQQQNSHDVSSTIESETNAWEKLQLSGNPESQQNQFVVHGLIGRGSFGEVFLVAHSKTGKIYAMKALHKSRVLKNNLVKYAMAERNVLCNTNHPFVVKLNYAFQTQDKLFLILEFCPGGDLGELLQHEKKTNFRLSEEITRIYLCEVLLALEYLHSKDIIFRDLKPDNIVLDADGHALLTDFGLSKEGVLDHVQGAQSFCGSVAYLAPEMLKRTGHGKAVDWYLFGVVMYELLVGIPPYYTTNKFFFIYKHLLNREELFENIKSAALKLPSYLSADAKSLLKSLLQRNPAKRLGSGSSDADEIKQHSFFKDINWNDVKNKLLFQDLKCFIRKLTPPKPKRTLKICTKFNQNVFDYQSIVDPEKEHINGWSFINQI